MSFGLFRVTQNISAEMLNSTRRNWTLPFTKVTIFGNEVWICDPTSEIRRTYTRVRSAKCLYLWKCGRRLEKEEMLY